MAEKNTYKVIEPLKCDGDRYLPGETVDMTPRQAAKCSAVGDEIKPEQLNNNPPESESVTESAPPATEGENPEARDQDEMTDPLADIVEAIGQLDPDNVNYWTNDGKPDARALSTLLGRVVSGGQRDLAWDVYQKTDSGE